MNADFSAGFLLNVPTGRVTVHATGTLVESRAAAGEPRKRKATITKLDIPLILRPFSNSIRKVVTDLIEVEQKPQEILPYQDVFIAEDRGDRILLGGVRADIVTEVMNTRGLGTMVKDPVARREIARWLWSPTKRESIIRGGPGPYMLTAMVDDSALVFIGASMAGECAGREASGAWPAGFSCASATCSPERRAAGRTAGKGRGGFRTP